MTIDMKARHLVCAALLFSAAQAQAGTPLHTRNKHQVVTYEFLMEACTVVGETAYGMLPHFDCESYLYGVLDAHAALMAPKVCAPPTLPAWKLYQDLLEVPRGQWNRPAAQLIVKTLARKYPCR
jgi:hypothetical protein